MANPNSKKFFKEQGDTIIFTGVYMEGYIPMSFFDSDIAVEYGGERIETMGLFNVKFFSDTEGKNQIGGLETINIPTTINIYPSSTKVEDISFVAGSEPEKYRVVQFYTGDVFTDLDIVKNNKNAERFLKILEAGKLPRTLRYRDVFDIWTKNMEINGVYMPDVPSANREAIVAELYRYDKQPADTFASHIGKDPKMSQYAYIPVNARTLTKYSSTFAGVTFEDFDTMVTNGININRSGRKENASPIEEIIKY